MEISDGNRETELKALQSELEQFLKEKQLVELMERTNPSSAELLREELESKQRRIREVCSVIKLLKREF